MSETIEKLIKAPVAILPGSLTFVSTSRADMEFWPLFEADPADLVPTEKADD